MSTRILVCDDHQLVLDGLKSLINGQDDIDVVSTANNGREALRQLEILKVDLILMDIDMPEMNGIEATKILKKDYPEIKIIILTMHDEKSIIQLLMDIGADGYILKNATQEELLQGIKQVQQGKKHFSPDVTIALLRSDKDVASINHDLTERELEILKLIAEGFSNKEIGDKLFISHRTVDTHRTNLMKKLEINNIAGLIRYAIKHSLVD